jgi:hypothetical protein
MEAKLMPVWLLFPVMLFPGCSQPARESSFNTAVAQVKPAAPPAPMKVYDVRDQDLTQISGLTSLNIAVEGVRLGTPTPEVNKLLGSPIKTAKTPQAYRCAYRGHGLYLDVDKYAGKVSRIYLNTLYAKRLKGGFAELLIKGDLNQLKRTFGDNPEQSTPDPQTTMWSYSQKGIAFLAMRQEEDTTYTLELSEPKR